ncbi:MAG: PA2169 family four-helix-bundle protein [Ignavibacteria bacterium]|nr:PA2169 family four-helix-bundle protein [Ignavibacteria bacterium]
MNNQPTIDRLNTLIDINNNRVEGYKTARDETLQNDLKIIFTKFINTSQECKNELVHEVEKLGGTPMHGTDTTSKLFRIWMDIKYALTCNDRDTVLNSCEHSEHHTVDIYTGILMESGEFLTDGHRELIETQLTRITIDYDSIKDLHSRAFEHQ